MPTGQGVLEDLTLGSVLGSRQSFSQLAFDRLDDLFGKDFGKATCAAHLVAQGRFITQQQGIAVA